MNKLMVAMLAAGAALAAMAEEPASAEPALAVEPAEELNWVSAEAHMSIDSMYLSYGFKDNKDPIYCPGATITFFEALTLGVDSVFDMTKYGRKAGYTNRAGLYTELDPWAQIDWTFSAEDYDWLPTSVELLFGYFYEYHPRHTGAHDTQFIYTEVTLPDLWLSPHFTYERDIDRDDGTYCNLELSKAFALIDGEDEDSDPELELTLSVAQGIGNHKRMAGYLTTRRNEAMHHAGLMDTTFKAELGWRVCDHVLLSGYVAYTEFLFDSTIREGARRYEATGEADYSYAFTGGLALALEF